MTEHIDIIYTKVDEAPELASGSFLPIIRAFMAPAGINIGVKDISLAGRILAQFPEYLPEQQRHPNDLKELGQLVKTPNANIIKLPNISASIPQLKECIKELQKQGYNIPNYPDDPKSDEEFSALAAYDRVKGSAVNPVLREGNSDRRAPKAVKEYARKNPHKMGSWSSNSKTHVASMPSGDFFSNEESTTISKAQEGKARIEFLDENGVATMLKNGVVLSEGEVVDATFLDVRALDKFLNRQIDDAKAQGVLFSLHLKATMMKVSDPIIFGHTVINYFSNVFQKHADTFAKLGINPNNGFGDLESKIQLLESDHRAEIETDIRTAFEKGPNMYMVNSEKGITNLHVPSDVIIDASMPAIIRSGGKAWGPDGNEHDVKCVIPDNSYAPIYSATIEFCKKYGAFDPSSMGTIPNVGLMAQKAEEYGSHPQTFVAPSNGKIKICDASGEIIHEHAVTTGDIWRMCTVKDAAIRDWVKLAVERARLTKAPAVFWLNKDRAHDAELIKKVEVYLAEHNVNDLRIHIMAPSEATWFSLERMKEGKDTISVTGNVLRDYLTDLFPILEVGTSAKMLSIVPLMNGGGLFETGAGGSAPKHVQQMLSEGHLRWDSLGEFCALGASLEHLASVTGNPKAALLASTLDTAIGKLLDNNQSPGRKVNEIDNRVSHFYLSIYWAEALSEQKDDADLGAHFSDIKKLLARNAKKVLKELNSTKGERVDIGGYFKPDSKKVAIAMRPSKTLNKLINELIL